MMFESDDSGDYHRKKGCRYFFKFLDNKILRPIFIYKYHQNVENEPHINFGDMLEEYKNLQ